MKRILCSIAIFLLLVGAVYLGFVQLDKKFMASQLSECEEIVEFLKHYKIEKGIYPDVGSEKVIVKSNRCKYHPDKELESFILIVDGAVFTKHAYIYQANGWVYTN
ncbi:hypothetical protein [Rheinheimera baltica]|uniref:hypothetical protein n=1 Tax=Rheinheimera baltica TaxID=67576 RepID=UPI000482CCDD|nr:hypothetical protein [Rheinheimera baltica]